MDTSCQNQPDFGGSLAGTKVDFPVKLHFLLVDVEQRGECDIVSWLPQGHAFKVHDKVKFVDQIIPRYFHSTKFKSFQRSLNLWGFESIRSGPDKGATFHRLFVRDQLKLCRLMVRKGSTKSNGSTQSSGSVLSNQSENSGVASRVLPNTMAATTIITPEPAEVRKKPAKILQDTSKMAASAALSPPLSLPHEIKFESDELKRDGSHQAVATIQVASSPEISLRPKDDGRADLVKGLSLLPKAATSSLPPVADIPGMRALRQPTQGPVSTPALGNQQQQHMLLALLQLDAARKERAAAEQLSNLCLANTLLQPSGSSNNGNATAALLSLILPGAATTVPPS